MALIVAVDIGGTFTDFLGYDSTTGRLLSAKSPSTPRELAQGIRNCIEKVHLSSREIQSFVHGSTVAINTVVERRGAKTLLVVTKGTRDVYKIGRGNRPDAYDIWFKRPEPLVPRHLIFEVEERLGPAGGTIAPFNNEQASDVARRVAEALPESVAVCFLHSWSNPIHEKLMGGLLKKVIPNAYTSLSHEILREYGEYERISTTVLNAYIGPKVSGYLDELEQMLHGQGFVGELLIMQSNGGAMSPSTAKILPAAMLESGPVGGFIAAARVGCLLNFRNAIAFDMGGTTAKANLIRDGEPQMSHGYHIGSYASGHPMMLPVVDTVEVGSGGGSIAHVDHVGSLQVGPQSAGAEPGPVCYGKGGTEPTVTDANLVLGRLDPSAFLGGEMLLNVKAAREAVAKKVAEPLGLSINNAALAIVKIAVMKMSLAVRQVSVERGYDPRDFAMIGFGGAGPLHAMEVARSLHIPTVIIPNFPGQFSANGMLIADRRHNYVRTYFSRLEQTDFAALRQVINELVSLGNERLKQEHVEEASIELSHFLEVRYAGQDFSIPVPILPELFGGGYADKVRTLFNEIHQQQFGYHDPDRPLEIVSTRLTAMAKHLHRDLPRPPQVKGASQIIGTRIVYFEDGDTPVDCTIYQRETLTARTQVKGPAIIQEYASTTVLFAGDQAEVAPSGDLVITSKDS